MGETCSAISWSDTVRGTCMLADWRPTTGVRSSVLDALASGYRVTVIVEAVRAVDLQPEDGARALQEMAEAGAAKHGV